MKGSDISMPRYRRIPQDAWTQARFVLLRYPESKEQYAEMLELATTRDPERKGNGPKPAHADPTQTAAIRLMDLEDSPRFKRIAREVKAVEDAMRELDQSEVAVIRQRFWVHREGVRTPMPYEFMNAAGYSERQMHRICQRVIRALAINLGEL